MVVEAGVANELAEEFAGGGVHDALPHQERPLIVLLIGGVAIGVLFSSGRPLASRRDDRLVTPASPDA